MGIETLITNAGARRTLRRLELEAYASVVSAFRAQGPFTGEKKVSLELLCKHLGISRERHRAEIRRAVNDELLTSVAGCISGTETENAWRKEGQKLTSMNPRFVARQVNHLPQVLASATVNAALGTNVVKQELEAKKATSVQVQNALKFIITQNPMTAPKSSPQSQLATKPKTTQAADKEIATIATPSSTTATIATPSSTTAAIATGSTTPATITTGSSTTATVATGSSTTATVATGSSTTAAIATSSSTTATVAASSSTTAAIATSSSTTATIATPSSTTATVAASSSKPVLSPVKPLIHTTPSSTSPKAAATQTVSAGIQTLSASTQTPQQSSTTDASNNKPLAVDQTTETSDKREQESKPTQLNIPDNPTAEAIKSSSHSIQGATLSGPKPVVSEDHSSDKVPQVRQEEIPKSGSDQSRAVQESSVGRPDQQEPLQSSVVEEKRDEVPEGTEAAPDTKHKLTKPQVDSKHEESLIKSAVDLQSATLPVQVSASATPVQDMDTSTVATTPTVVSSTSDDAPKQTPLRVVATTIIPASKPVGVPATNTSVLTSPLSVVGDNNVPTTETQSRENRKRPLTPTSLPPAKKPAPPPLLTPTLSLTPGTPHVPIPALTPISIHTDTTTINPTSTAVKPLADFSHKQRYPPPPLVHASTVTRPDITSRLQRRSASPSTSLERPHGEIQLRTLLQGAPVVTTSETPPLPLPTSLPSLPAVIQRSSSPPPPSHPPTSTLPSTVGSPLLPRLTSPPPLTLPPTPSTTPTPAPSNTDAFIQALCSDPSSLEDSTVSALATQLGLDLTDLGLLAGSDLLQLMQPIGTEPVSASTSADAMMETQLSSMKIPQPVTGMSDNPLPGHSAGVGQTEAIAASPGTTPGGVAGLLMTPTPQEHVGMLGELCLQPSGGDTPMFPDLSSLSSSANESELLEGIPQELAETIQALARLDEQNTAYSPIQ